MIIKIRLNVFENDFIGNSGKTDILPPIQKAS
jgi:hypothetical protein